MIEIDFLQKKSMDSSPYDSDKMASEFIQQFNNQAFTVGQQVQNILSRTLFKTVKNMVKQMFNYEKKKVLNSLSLQNLYIRGHNFPFIFFIIIILIVILNDHDPLLRLWFNC